MNKSLRYKRTIEQIREHYEVEKELAERLRNARRGERRRLYSKLYDELYERIPHHPQLMRKDNRESRKRAVAAQVKILSRFLTPETTFLELGPGDCMLSFEVAKRVQKVYAIDVSDEITKSFEQPPNFELILSDGSSIDVPSGSVDVAYSNQLMEHLHPEDAVDQVRGVYNALIPGGIYICITPHRFSGPHDISRYFDDVATGFHLKEYTHRELYDLLKKVGFKKIEIFCVVRDLFIKLPIYPSLFLELLLEPLSISVRRFLSKVFFSNLRGEELGIRIIATK